MKVLILGSAGFLMSNLIRYMIYREKSYNFCSIDRLNLPEDYKRIYVHRNHKLYVGNIDKYLLERVSYIEKPDVIINSISDGVNTANKIFEVLPIIHKVFPNIRIIQLVDEIPENKYVENYDEIIANWQFVEKRISLYHGTILKIPKVFGIREKNGPFVNILKSLMKKEVPKLSTKLYPWVYAEDVASKIWYLIENKNINYTSIPALGNVSDQEMARLIDLNLEKDLFENYFVPQISPEQSNDDWQPDSTFEDSLQKTIKWYKINQWAL